MFAFIVNHFPAVAVAVPVILFIIAGIHSANTRRTEAAQAAALEAEKARKAEEAVQKRRRAEEQKRAAQATREREAAARQIEQSRKREQKEAAQAVKAEEQKRRRAERLEAARELAEYKERALKAALELRKLDDTQTPGPAPDPEPATAPAQAPEQRPESVSYNNPLAGHVVSFTGKLQSMKRTDAIKAVQAVGGRAYADFPAGTDILVVGTNPGEKKQEKFDRWIGQVKKITEAQFLEMLKKGA